MGTGSRKVAKRGPSQRRAKSDSPDGRNLRTRLKTINAYAAAFIASFSMLVIEIVAGRILAPYLGVSLYTWTSIIGVVLAGISVGAFLGGWFADRHPGVSTLGWILFLSGLTALTIPPLTHSIAGTFFHSSLMVRILLVTAFLFFIPSCFLGMVSPAVIRLTLPSLAKTGNVVGTIYAFSTLGSILGTFAAGFFLISWMGTRNLLFTTGILLLLAAPLFGGFFLKRKRIVLFLLLLPCLWPLYHYASNPVLAHGALFFKESDYFTIRLLGDAEKGKGRLITLYLDQLTHSCSDPDDPLRLQYRYIRGYREITQWQVGSRKSFETLFIGGGGYTFPRFIEAHYPDAGIDVVEIDPAVTEVSRRYLGLSGSSRIQTFHQDARWFVINRKGEGKYDLIFEDVFNDLSIPYHLTTREFAVALKRLLKKDGLLLTNVIDRFEKGSFLPSYIRTLEEVFGKGNVHLITFGSSQNYVDNRIVLASPQKLDTEDLSRSLDRLKENDRLSYLMPQEQLQNLLQQFDPVVLTDDYAPVDNLTAPNFK